MDADRFLGVGTSTGAAAECSQSWMSEHASATAAVETPPGVSGAVPPAAAPSPAASRQVHRLLRPRGNSSAVALTPPPHVRYTACSAHAATARPLPSRSGGGGCRAAGVALREEMRNVLEDLALRVGSTTLCLRAAQSPRMCAMALRHEALRRGGISVPGRHGVSEWSCLATVDGISKQGSPV